MRLKNILVLLFLSIIFNSSLIAQQPDVVDSTQQNLNVAKAETLKNQIKDSPPAQVFDPSTMTDITNFGSIWEITKLAGGLRWGIILVLVVGLASVLYKYADFIIDSIYARPINKLDLLKASYSQIEDVVSKNIYKN